MTALLEPAFDAAWLMRQHFPPTKYVVPGIIPEGLTLLVAAPKIGKSWMVLGLGVELGGIRVFGRRVADGKNIRVFVAVGEEVSVSIAVGLGVYVGVVVNVGINSANAWAVSSAAMMGG